jgi:hypothetical protein
MQTDFILMQNFSPSGCAGQTQAVGDTKQLMNLSLSVATVSISLVLQHLDILQHLTRSLYILPRSEEEAKHVLKEVHNISLLNSLMRASNIINIDKILHSEHTVYSKKLILFVMVVKSIKEFE